MDVNGILENYALPDGAKEDIMRAISGLQMRNLEQGVSMMSGHDDGVPFVFYREDIKNEQKTKLAKVPMFDTVDMVMWLKSKFCKPNEQVRFLPEGLLHIDEEGNPSGKPNWVEAWKRYKEGLSAKGTPLDKWGQLDSSLVQTLVHSGVFSVEQFASIPASRIKGKYPIEIVNAHEQAIFWVNGQQGKFELEGLATKAMSLEQDIAKRDLMIERLEERLAKLEGSAPKKVKKAKEPKVEEESSEQ